MEITLNIFDFDGTLFRSPVPNPERWDAPLIGRLMNTTDCEGLGWFQDPITLEHPYVPEVPDDTWFVPHIKESVLNSIKDQNSVTVLLTGRNEKYSKRIRTILESAGLMFNEYGFKPVSDTPIHTLMFKQQFISGLITNYKPGKINVWEDRVRHAEALHHYFRVNFSFLEFKVHMVESAETYLPQELEFSLVLKLMENSKNDLHWEEHAMYTAVFLTNESKELLKKVFPPIPGWREFYHHMTICLGSLKDYHSKNLPSIDQIGSTVQLEVVKLGKDERGYAVEVTGVPSINTIPHVTMCVHPNAAPRHSNDIVSWRDCTETERITITGIIDEKRKLFYKKIPHPPSHSTKKNEVMNIGKMIAQLTSRRGREVGLALTEVNQWMLENNIQNTSQNEEVVKKFIVERFN